MKRFLFLCSLFIFAVSFLCQTQITYAAQRFSGSRSIGRQVSSQSYMRSSYGTQRPSSYTRAPGTESPRPTNSGGGTHWALPAAGGFVAGLGTAALVSHLSQPSAAPTSTSTTNSAGPASPPPTNGTATHSPTENSTKNSTTSTSMLPIIILIIVILAAFFLMRRALNKNTGRSSFDEHAGANTHQQDYGPTHPMSSRFETLLGEPEPAFLDKSKALFLSVQKAFDTRDKVTLEKLVTQDIFEEMAGDLSKQPDGELSITMLNASLRNVVEENHTVIASVYFQGLIRESEKTASLSEVWHLAQRPDQSWIVEGISQEPLQEG